MGTSTEWAEPLMAFFQKAELRQCLHTLQLEAVVFPSTPSSTLNEHLCCLAKDIGAYLDKSKRSSSEDQPDKAADQANGAQQDPEKSPPEIADADSRLEKEEKRRRLAREVVQNTSAKDEMAKAMDDFVAAQWKEINSNNRDEFLRPAAKGDTTCARVDAKEKTQGVYIQLDVVHNQDSALERSTAAERSAGDDVKPPPSLPLSGLDERVENIRDHLHVKFVPESADIYRRVAALEDKIMLLERDFPVWSATNFNQPGRRYTQPPPVTVYRLLPPPPAAAVSAVPSTVAAAPTSVPAPSASSRAVGSSPQPNASADGEAKHQPTPKRRKVSTTPLKAPLDRRGKPLFHTCGRGVNSSLTRSVLAQLQSRQKVV
ncbi:hypothetical protein GQ54DRAFT_248391, partial [Martensiomyces pterosporus]